jgi:muramoyltetrapeptide carboxypeptidase
MERKGFELVVAKNCTKRYGHSAGFIQESVTALHEFFIDEKIKGIISFWGGYQTHQLLDKLDYHLIKNNPKVLLGYSDTTVLQNAIFVKTGLITFSGPAGITFAKPIVPSFTWEGL